MQTDLEEQSNRIIINQPRIIHYHIPSIVPIPKYYFSTTSASSMLNCQSKHDTEPIKTISNSQVHFLEKFICDKTIAFEPLDTKISSISDIGKKPSIKRWYFLLNVVLPIVHMKRIKAHLITTKTLDFLTLQSKKAVNTKKKTEAAHQGNDSEINKDNALSDNRKKEEELTTKKDISLNYITNQMKLFEYIEQGCDGNIGEITSLLRNEPKLLNDFNYNRLTPLYAACLNGHRKIVEVLLEYHANHLLLCDDESVMDVAIRFSYVDIVKLLKEKCTWPRDYVKKSQKNAKGNLNKKIKEMLMNWDKTKKKNRFLGCFCFN